MNWKVGIDNVDISERANGFVGQNLIFEINNRGYKDPYKFIRDTDKSLALYKKR